MCWHLRNGLGGYWSQPGCNAGDPLGKRRTWITKASPSIAAEQDLHTLAGIYDGSHFIGFFLPNAVSRLRSDLS